MEQTPPIINIVGAYYAKTHFSELLDRLEAGESYIITRNGKEVATVIPKKTVKSSALKYKALSWIENRKSLLVTPDKVSIRDLINWGRKY